MVNSAVWKVQNVDIGRDHQGEAAGQRGARARRCPARVAQQPARRTGGDRACARALQQSHAGEPDCLSEDADRGDEGERCSAITRALTHYDHKTNWRQAHLIHPGRSGPCLGNRQDTAGNRCGMQRRSPKPCRRRHCLAQTGRPHRRARGEALRHAVDGNRATRCGLTAEQNERE